MKFNAVQNYLLKVYTITITFFTFFVPVISDGELSFNFSFLCDQNCLINIPYLALIYVGITLATIALLCSFKDYKKRK